MPLWKRNPNEAAQLLRAHRIVTLIDELRDFDGATVTLFCDNPDFNGLPNCVIEYCGDSTNWCGKSFRGDTLEACLQKAVQHKRGKQ